MRKGRNGFTLVELSIVLVIIGLLIGGILVAQSMISTANVTATVRQIGQFDAGVENFKTKYGYLPGDAPMFGGDGDGILTTGPVNGQKQTAFNTCEIANFWNSMDPELYPLKTACTFTLPVGSQAVTTSGALKNVPLSKLGSANSFVSASAMSIGDAFSADTSNPANYYVILAPSQLQTPSAWHDAYCFTPTTSSNSAVKPADLLALDTKIDDGIANSGNILSGDIEGYFGEGSIYTNPLSTCSQGAAYQVQNNTYECTPLIRIGAQTGDPQ